MRNPADLAVKKIQQKPTKQEDPFFFSVWYELREIEGKSYTLSPSRPEQKRVLKKVEEEVEYK